MMFRRKVPAPRFSSRMAFSTAVVIVSAWLPSANAADTSTCGVVEHHRALISR